MNQFDKLSAEAIQTALDGRIPLPEIHALVDSTNQRAKVLAREGAPAFTAVIADNQTKGHGRYGRHFHSASGGGLYMTLILRPTLDSALLPQLTHYAALAVAEALESLVPSLHIEIKWVNDLFLNGKKLAGILAETVFGKDTQKIEAVALGIGINLRGSFPSELEAIATAIDRVAVPPSRNALAAAIIERMISAEQELAEGSYMARYRRRSFLIGRGVTVMEGENSTLATVLAIEDDGALRVLTADGAERILRAGEVSLKID